MDARVSAVVLGIFVFWEGCRLGTGKLCIHVLCNLLVGVSLALPLFLYFRHPKVNASGP